jgi:hypothetical protein
MDLESAKANSLAALAVEWTTSEYSHARIHLGRVLPVTYHKAAGNDVYGAKYEVKIWQYRLPGDVADTSPSVSETPSKIYAVLDDYSTGNRLEAQELFGTLESAQQRLLERVDVQGNTTEWFHPKNSFVWYLYVEGEPANPLCPCRIEAVEVKN